MNYYNEFDPKAAAWLRELIKQGIIPPGDVDERSISEIKPHELAKYTQCHFFAGIGGWAFALSIAGWPADRPVGTGSCPCQPFSAAGKGLGSDDERHLWPVFFDLIVQCRALGQKWALKVFGEQVASAEVVGNQLEAAFVDAVQGGDFAEANRLAHELARSPSLHFDQRWLDGIRADLETADYSFRCEVLGAHSAGSPNIRQRLYWLAHAPSRGGFQEREEAVEGEPELGGGSRVDGMANAEDNGREGRNGNSRGNPSEQSERPRSVERLADPDRGGQRGQRQPEPSRLEGESGDLADRRGEICAGRMADTDGGKPGNGELQPSGLDGQQPKDGGPLRMGDALFEGLEGHGRHVDDRDEPGRNGEEAAGSVAEAGAAGGMEDAAGRGRGRGAGSGERAGGLGRAGEDGFWDAYDLIPCTDGKARRVEPGSFPLAHGIPGRVGLLRGYGNAINPWVAAKFIKEFLNQ